MQVFLEVSNADIAKKEMKVKRQAKAMTWCWEVSEYLDMVNGAYPHPCSHSIWRDVVSCLLD